MISNQVPSVPTTLSLPQSKQDKYTCICCRIKLESVELQRGHFKTEWHLYNLKRRVCSLDPIDLDSFNEIQAIKPEKQDDESSIFSELRAVNWNNNSNPKRTDGLDELTDDDWEQLDYEELLDEAYDEIDIAEMLTRLIDPDTCLFCDKKSSTAKINLTHMNEIHGFFIPEVKYLVDLEGFMDYLGFKVGAASTCLWCNKQFTTVHGVRLHMIYKDHCKILYDHGKATEEFKEFYDYSTQERIEMKDINQLVVSKKRYTRQAEYNRIKEQQSQDGNQLIPTTANLNIGSSSSRARGIKKFDSDRAKVFLKTGIANNQNARGRLRRQNPI